MCNGSHKCRSGDRTALCSLSLFLDLTAAGTEAIFGSTFSPSFATDRPASAEVAAYRCFSIGVKLRMPPLASPSNYQVPSSPYHLKATALASATESEDRQRIYSAEIEDYG